MKLGDLLLILGTLTLPTLTCYKSVKIDGFCLVKAKYEEEMYSF